MTSKVLIVNANIVTEEEVVSGGSVMLAGERIESVSPSSAGVGSAADVVVDARGGWLLPGFIDVHVHGGYGADFMEATPEALETITRFHGGNGTTVMLATTVTAPHDRIVDVLKAVRDYRQREMPYARLLGVHLEGPFISHKWPGAQNPAYIVPPQKQWVERWVADYPGLIRQLTLAPETEGALELIARLRGRGIVVAAGHTDATYEQIEAAVEAGLSQAVHTFNAMTGLHHRKPGTAGAVLSDDRIAAEVIADGHHVHPACIKLLARAKPADKLILITDAMAAAGLGDGLYDLGGLAVVVKDGVARLKEGDSLAGSTLTMIDAFRFVVEKVGVSVPDASRMASGNPARQLGIFGETGSITPGKRADVLLVTPDLRLERIWIGGREMEPFRK